ncbi:MAG: M14 family metallopeptidase [Bacteroidota bacterium]|nr:M14 family metallopeptidase [Bacteroidota bacterium]
MARTIRRLLPFGLVLLLLPGAQAQLQSPAEYLGYELGKDFTPHHRVVEYVQHVAAEASNVNVLQYGNTYEGRPLMLAVISSDAKMANLEALRQANLRHAGLMEGPADAESPAIVWLSYNVHGNESVSTEAALATLHTLAGNSDPRTRSWLENTIVIIDPCVNPDGRERYVSFYRSTRGRWPDVHPDAREHAEPWPGGRTNHYYFDLNRDWAWATQKETRERLVYYNRWMPHVHVDFHEMGVNSPYFFAPAAKPYHNFITPWQRELQVLMGQNHAKYFDREGWLFFTRQVFDLFYPGYGDTWPVFNGAIGMTYEQGGSGRAGLGIVTAEGDTLTLRDRIDHHVTTSLSTIEVAADHREKIVREFAAYFAQGAAQPAGDYETYVISLEGQQDQVVAIERHLDHLGIRYGAATADSRQSAFAYRSGTTQSAAVREGDLVVPAAQPKGVLTRVLFDPVADLADSLSYDITAWSLPYVYDVEAYAVDSPIAYAAAERKLPARNVSGPAVAYVAEWQSFEDAKLLAELLRRGVRVRFSEVPFTIDDRSFSAGTLIMTQNGLDAAWEHTVLAAAEAAGQSVIAVSSTLVDDGADFGSSDVPYLDPPRVAVIADPAAGAYALGELWHYFDRQLAYPVSLIQSDALPGLHLYNFDVIILPSGGYGDVLTENRLEELLEWIRAGGRLIAIESAARFLAGKDGFGLKQPDEDEDPAEESDAPLKVKSYKNRSREDISEEVTGAIFRAQMDSSHPLAFGYDEAYFTLKRSSEAYPWLEDGWNVAVVRKGALVSGFAGHKADVLIRDSLLFGTESIGRGEVVYLMDNPIFRGFWYGGHLLLANAVFLVGQRSVSAY